MSHVAAVPPTVSQPIQPVPPAANQPIVPPAGAAPPNVSTGLGLTQDQKANLVQAQAPPSQRSPAPVNQTAVANSQAATNPNQTGGVSPATYFDSLGQSNNAAAKQYALATAGIGINVTTAA
jgi:hypothetical protein